MEMFEVGGCVRDEILGIPSKDIDFTAVLEPGEITMYEHLDIWEPFDIMANELKVMGFEIFLESPQFFTVRARFPKGHQREGLTADFVLARKERGYSDGRRPDSVEVGTLRDDLARRDFTMNAVAKDSQGNLIDPFGGQRDIEQRLIRCVGKAEDRILGEDALRGLRAIRFSVTKGFEIDQRIWDILKSEEFHFAIRSVSAERIREELEKAFKASTLDTTMTLVELGLVGPLFNGRTGIRLMPTMKG